MPRSGLVQRIGLKGLFQVVRLESTNTGKVTCTLYRHPAVAQMNADRQVGRPAIWTGTPATVALKPGGTAHAVSAPGREQHL